MKSFTILIVSAVLLAACNGRPPVYRATAKLLVTRSGLSSSNVDHEDNDRFIATQVDIILSQTLLRRVQQRLKKSTEEIRNSLVDLKVAPIRGSDIILISVDSPSGEFAMEFANALTGEYLAFRNEQRAETSQNGLLDLTREANRLGQELKAINEKIAAFVNEHVVSPDAELPELQALREDRERVRSLYNALLAQLMKIDAAQTVNTRTVSVLEPAIVEKMPEPWYRR